MADTGRVISRRYLLQRLLKQGQFCGVYEGFDQVLQRVVTVKAAPAEQAATYRTALRTTAQFSHPNIVGVYDLILEPDHAYIVQEYVDGDDFASLLQHQLTPFEVADLGVQICQALLYAASPTRQVCHGDLTPASILRDRRGLVRVNNFALPSDLHYFNAWSTIGGSEGLSDQDLPRGKFSEARGADDVRAVGILLYQHLTGRSPGTSVVEPPADGRLRFMRSVPAELCEVIARAIIQQHPQHIETAQVLYTELKTLAESLEPPVPVAATAGYQANEGFGSARQLAPTARGSGPLAAGVSVQETDHGPLRLPETSAPLTLRSPSASLSPSPALPDMSVKLAAARQAAYQTNVQPQGRRMSIPLLLLIGLVLFALFFVVGYFIATTVFAR